MGTSVLETLIVPVIWTTLVASIAGASILTLMNAIEALVGRLRHTPGAARHRRIVRTP